MRADRLEICRDFLRSTCTRNDLLKEGRSHEKLAGTLCKYAHPERVSSLEYCFHWFDSNFIPMSKSNTDAQR